MPTGVKFEFVTRFFNNTLKMVGQQFAVDTTKLNTNTEFHPANFRVGAGGFDGIADDTTYVLLARDAAQSKGGVVVMPSRCRVREEVLVDQSNTITRVPVYFRGQGEGGSVLLFDPLALGDDCLHFKKSLSGDSYCEGGASRITIQCTNPLATGNGLRCSGTYRTKFSDVWAHGFLGSGGLGLKVESQDGQTPQHLRIYDCHFQGNARGIDIEGVQDMVAVGMVVNQNVELDGVIRSGVMRWYGGTLQGGLGTLELRPPNERAIQLVIDGCYFEVTGSANAIKGYPPLVGTEAGKIKITNALNNGSYTFCDLDGYTIHMENILVTTNPMMLKARNSTLKAVDCTPFADKWDLDDVTLARSTFDFNGCVTYGMLPTAPDLQPVSAKFASPIRVANFTQTDRDDLTDQEEGCLGSNTTTQLPNIYTGGRWRSLGEARVIEIAPTVMRHFDSRRGAGQNKWADQVGDLVFTGVNAPVLEHDGKNFRGHPVWKFVSALSQYMDTGNSGPVDFAIGAGTFYARMIARRTGAPAGFGTFLNMFDNAATVISGQVMDHTGDGAFEAEIVTGRTNFGPPPVQDLLVHRFEIWLTPTLQMFAIDSVGAASTGTTGLVLTAPIERYTIGAFLGPVFAADCNIAEFMEFPEVPSDDIRAALDERDYDVWGIG